MKQGGGSVIIPLEEGDVSELVSPNHSTHANRGVSGLSLAKPQLLGNNEGSLGRRKPEWATRSHT